MKITIAFVLIALLATSFGFRVRQTAADVVSDVAAAGTTLADQGLEDTELLVNQAIEDTEANVDCMAGCTEMATWAQCAANCLSAAVQTANEQASSDMETMQGQMQGGAAAPAAE